MHNFERPKLIHEDIIKRDVEKLRGRTSWKDLPMDRGGWRIRCKIG